MAPLPDLKVLLPLLTSLLFAGSFVAGKYTTVELGPLTTSLLRNVIALGVLTLLARGRLAALLALNLNRGDALMLGAVLCWVIYALIIKQLSQRYSGLTLTFYAAVAGVGQLLVLAASERWWRQLANLSLSSLLAILYMGVAASGIAYLLFNLSIQRVGPTRTASVVYSLVPIFVAALAWLFFREPLTTPMVVSMGLILLGVNVVLSQPNH